MGSEREKLIAGELKDHRLNDESAKHLRDEHHVAQPGKRTLIEQQLTEGLADGINSRLAVGRRTLIDQRDQLPAPDESRSYVAVLSSIGSNSTFDVFRSHGLEEVLAALASIRGGRGLIQATLSAAKRATNPAVHTQSVRPAPPDPSGQAIWQAAERRAVTLYRRAMAGDIRANDPVIEEALQRVGGGQALPGAVRLAMERRFGMALDRVRVHTDSVAAAAARAIRAEAFTLGEDIFFAEGAFAPETEQGAKLLAHEVAHVVQGWQRRTGNGEDGLRISQPSDDLECEADAIADRLGMPESLTDVHSESERKHRTAQRGVSGSGDSLPYLDQIQKSFGPVYDLSQVRAHVGGKAAEATNSIGAEAYATGNRIAFREAPSLHMAAHEAAHVVQQAASVRLPDGVGQVGDEHECNADAVADRVVQGQPAQDLLPVGVKNATKQTSATRAIQLAPPGSAKDKTPTARIDSDIDVTPIDAIYKEAVADPWSSIRGFAKSDMLKRFVAQGDMIGKLMSDHISIAKDALRAKSSPGLPSSQSLKVVIEQDLVAYNFVAWHIVVGANMEAMRFDIKRLVQSFAGDARDFGGRQEIEQFILGAQKLIERFPKEAEVALSRLNTTASRFSDARRCRTTWCVACRTARQPPGDGPGDREPHRGEAVREVALRPRVTACGLPAAFWPRGGNAAHVRQ